MPIIKKTRLYNFDPLKPHFYIVKNWGLQWYTLFLFLLKNIACGYLLELPHRGSSNGYPQSMFWAETWKISDFLSENLQFFGGDWLIVLGFNDTSTLEGHFVSSPREREKRDRRESRGDEREGQGRKRNRNESEETEEIKTFPLYPYPLQG